MLCFRLSSFLVVLTLLGCSSEAPSPPSCRTSVQTPVAGQSAGCIIRVQNDVLLLRLSRSNTLNIPGGTRQSNDSLACTAHRHTWEQTGLNVFVRAPVSVSSNGMVLFACDENANLDLVPAVFSPPTWSINSIKSLEKIAPFSLSHKSLNEPDDLIPIRDGFVRHKTQSNIVTN